MVHHLHINTTQQLYQTANQAAVQGVLGDHLHLLDHQDIKRLAGAFHGQYGIGDHAGEVVGELQMSGEKRGNFLGELGAERGAGHIVEGLVIVFNVVHRLLE